VHRRRRRSRRVGVALSVSPCAGELVAPERLASLLAVELASSLAQPIALTVGGDANWRLSLDCSETRDMLDIEIQRRVPPGSYRGRVNVEQLPERMRSRTIALALSEDLRWLDEPKLEAPAPPAPAAPALILTTRPTRDARVMRLSRDVTIGLAASAVVLALVGGPILGVGNQYHPPDIGMVASGAVLTTLSVISFAGAGVSFGFWAHERLRPE
jgi:hypothetical protein